MQTMKTALAILFLILGIAGSAFIAIWWGIVQPIVEIVHTIQSPSGPDSWIIASALFKFFVRDILAGIWLLCWCAFAKAVID
jgi:hypothetical protein